jgi:mRNA interferase HigB
MRVLKPARIKEAIAAHPEWEASLVSWLAIAKAANWRHSADLKNSWKNFSIVGRCVRFEISHNKCRLIAWINYRTQKVFIRHILSHAEYDTGVWKNDCNGS